jgi:hypothetical protein
MAQQDARSKGEDRTGVRGLAGREREIQCRGPKPSREAVGDTDAPDHDPRLVESSILEQHNMHASRTYLGVELAYRCSAAFRGRRAPLIRR